LPHVALAGAEGGSNEGRARSGIQRRWWGNVELPDRPPSFGMGLLEFVIWWATTAISGKRWRSAALDRRAAAPVAAGCGEGSARVRRCAGDGGEVQVATGPPLAGLSPVSSDVAQVDDTSAGLRGVAWHGAYSVPFHS